MDVDVTVDVGRTVLVGRGVFVAVGRPLVRVGDGTIVVVVFVGFTVFVAVGAFVLLGMAVDVLEIDVLWRLLSGVGVAIAIGVEGTIPCSLVGVAEGKTFIVGTKTVA